ncbi:hypothetical protein J1614_000594 [Plenodomus biglobosus]|nr:hypothetical protein J1614_000594 [Plenodomus biglobosus]
MLARSFWKPAALRAPVLIFTAFTCWSLIAILQYFLIKSQQDGGILFAPKISNLPRSQQFLYLYFPTVLAVIFSMYWAWIDLETKRMEPYYQLSKDGGALGKDCLLLQYPFDFLPLVPIRAFRERHWPVFWASISIVIVTWGLVPVQAGVFSIRTIQRSFDAPFSLSTSFMPTEQQVTNLTLRYAQSTFGIATLNETLPAYMARNFTLAPFKPAFVKNGVDIGTQGTWTAVTNMYGVDLYCEVASPQRNASDSISGTVLYQSNSGCNVTMGLTGNVTKGFNSNKNIYAPLLSAKDYMAMYIGYYNGGFSDYSLEGSCPPERNSTFYAAFSRNKARASDVPNNVTAIFCEPIFFEQEVNATVDMGTRLPTTITPVGDKKQLSSNLFNTTYFQIQMNGGSGYEVRGNNLPIKSQPDYLERIAETNVSLLTGPTGAGTVQPMVGLSLTVSDRPFEDYLDWKVLSKSYADAYRLMFSRAMVDVLNGGVESAVEVSGRQQYTTQAVVLEPVFTYIVQGFLGVVSIATLALLYLSVTRTRKLYSDPSSIASVMSLVADSDAFLSEFEGLDCCTIEDVYTVIADKRYRLIDDGGKNSIVGVDPAIDAVLTAQQPVTLSQRRNTPRNIAKPVRPVEFRLYVAIPFVTLFIALAVTLGVIYIKAQVNGLPLPSKNTLVQNLLENYIPTALATLIEPMWILINRLLCMLQPIEELQACNAPAKKSVDLNYSSLPPQLTILKALFSGHFVLAAVCAMALLANILAVAFAGIFVQDSRSLKHSTYFDVPFEMKFVSINGSIGPQRSPITGSLEPSGAYRGGNSQDQFLIAESNFTRGTPLPAWTDERFLYLPYFSSASVNATNQSRYQAQTAAFGAELDCATLESDIDYRGRIVKSSDLLLIQFNTTTPPELKATICPVQAESSLRWGPIRPDPNERIKKSCQRGASATEVVFVVEASANATQEVKDACMTTIILGWIRSPDGSCGDFPERDLDKSNSAFVRCTPRLITGEATVQVDATGRLQEKAVNLRVNKRISPEVYENLFSNGPVNLIGQANQYLFKLGDSGWHNDSFSQDVMNYFAMRESKSNRLVDPNKGVPALADIQEPLSKAYSRLFAIWLGANKEKLLLSHDNESKTSIQGWTIFNEQRLLVSTPMFIISETILCIYAIVAIMVYLRRPGQYLARMPTSIAAIVSLFAASAAVQDMRDTSQLDRKERARFLKKVDSRYGYGSYVGTDGRVHVGIDKTPFVRVKSKTNWLEKNVYLFRKGPDGH